MDRVICNRPENCVWCCLNLLGCGMGTLLSGGSDDWNLDLVFVWKDFRGRWVSLLGWTTNLWFCLSFLNYKVLNYDSYKAHKFTLCAVSSWIKSTGYGHLLIHPCELVRAALTLWSLMISHFRGREWQDLGSSSGRHSINLIYLSCCWHAGLQAFGNCPFSVQISEVPVWWM